MNWKSFPRTTTTNEPFLRPRHRSLTVKKILNLLFQGPIWKAIRGKGLAYGVSVIPDYDNHEMIIRIHDSPDVIEAMAVIKQTMVSTMVDILKSLKNNAYPKVSL